MKGGERGCICVSERDWVFGKVKGKKRCLNCERNFKCVGNEAVGEQTVGEQKGVKERNKTLRGTQT